MNIILPGHLIAKYKALATYRFIITSQNAGKGQVILEAAHQAAQSAFEPGDQATAWFFETPMLGAGLHSYFFSMGMGRYAASVHPTQTHRCMWT